MRREETSARSARPAAHAPLLASRTTRLAARTAAAVVICSMALAACSTAGATAPGTNGRVVQVVAAENFWGSIAAQIGGRHAHVVSIITNPNADPHIYEPTAADARELAQAQVVIEQ